ncbi:MAG: tRNA lysidine(34) synthetase TilS, partial [Myxococcota bacterium]|nr:tRNA lysidine(34) synthetase TilS [Myxococcota bacterium]
FLKRLIQEIHRHRLWSPGERVLLAVSGGMDSITLMHALVRTQGAHKGILDVMSIDHGLRTESKEEVLFVQQQAYDLGIPFSSVQLNMTSGGNLQERARHARREALLATGSTRIATGHHANDQAETVLYRLLRGSGLDGLRGMQPLSIPWCRPFLSFKRETLFAWAQQEKLRWIDDPSNPGSLRGRMRPLFTQLDGFHGDSVMALARSAELLGQDAIFLEEYTLSCWNDCFDGTGLLHTVFEVYPFAIQFRLLRKLCQTQGVPVRARLLQQVLRTGSHADFPGGQRLYYGSLIRFLEKESRL